MRKRAVWLIVATVLILTGSILFVGVMSKMNWNLTTGRYETNTHAVTDVFTHISIDTTTADIAFAPSEDDTVSVVCYEEVNVKHTVSVEGDTLVIEEVDTREWYQRIYVFSDSPKITVYLPAGAYGALKLEVTTGDVTVPDGYSFTAADIKVTTGDITFSADVVGAMTLKATTGDVTLSSVACGDLTTTGTTGDVTLRNVIGNGTFSIHRTTGDVTFDACDAAALTVKTTTGDVTGTLLSPKEFDAHATTGDVSVPATADGGKCKINVTTGDIQITIQ